VSCSIHDTLLILFFVLFVERDEVKFFYFQFLDSSYSFWLAAREYVRCLMIVCIIYKGVLPLREWIFLLLPHFFISLHKNFKLLKFLHKMLSSFSPVNDNTLQDSRQLQSLQATYIFSLTRPLTTVFKTLTRHVH